MRHVVGGHWIKLSMGSFTGEGEPDIIGVKDGHFYGFELKTPIGRLSEMQKEKLQMIRDAGGTAMQIRDLETLKNVFKI